MITRLLRRNPARSSKGGMMLLWAVFASMAMFTSAFVLSTLASSSKRMAEVNLRRSSAEYLSQAAMTHATAQIYSSLQSGFEPPGQGTVDVDGTQVTYSITLTGGPVEEQDASGLNQIVSWYRVEGSAEWEDVPSVSRQIVEAIRVPLFQFALFYEGDMEFLYPAPMTISGRVHSNSDIYLYAQYGLDFNTNYFRAAGGIYNRPHYDEWADMYPWGPNNPARVRRYVDDPFDGGEPFEYEQIESKTQMDSWGISSASGFDSDFAGHDDDGNGDFLGAWDWLPFGPRALEQFSEPEFYTGSAGTTMQTGEHGVLPVDVPEIQDFAMFIDDPGGDYIWSAADEEYVPTAAGTGTHVKGPFHEKAGLSIITADDGTYEAYDANGVEITADVASAVSMTTMYDARQAAGSGESIQMAVIDIDLLGDSGRYPSNGLLYVASYGAGTGTDVKGFQLTNGSQLPGDLSVVSPDSLYVHGNFNTTAKKSASVMADAVNLLSNSWTNSKTPGSLPWASSTTYNMAILTGDGEATAESYNGGPHNLPRFHERWTWRTASILGSLVCLGNSVRATGPFKVYGDYYQAPNRNWTYDEDFNDTGNLPPFTPVFVDVNNVVAW